jgi:hypothetical protein
MYNLYGTRCWRAKESTMATMTRHVPERSTSAPHGGVPTVREAVRPAADGEVAGGDGGVTAFHDNNGRLLFNCRVVLVFWGSDWGKATTNPSANQFAGAMTGLVTGVWGTQLSQYRGIGPMSVEKTVLVTTSDPPTRFTNADIQTMLKGQINGGNLPAPANNIDRVYAVLMPTGHSSGDTSFVGQHQFFDLNGARAYYAWVTNDGTLTGGNSIPKVFSHELAEAVSDPNLGSPDSGILVDIGSDKNEEIGDVCNNTWMTVNGAAQEAYWSNTDNRCVIPRLQPFPAVGANPALVQGRFGRQGNFELVTASGGTGLYHFWRNNDNRFMPWSTATPFGQSVGAVAGVSMIESNFGSPGNLEVVVRVGNQMYAFWRDSGPAFKWNGPGAFGAAGVSGNPVLIQSRFGRQGNFELVVPLASGGLAHYWRNNDNPAFPWSAPTPFGQNSGTVDAVTMIESNFGSPGNLEVIGRVGSALCFFWRDSGPAFKWNGPFGIGISGVSGNPALIQSRFGRQGNFEMVVPLASGGLAHYWRNNDNPAFPWSGPTPFGQGLGHVDAVTMIQSNYGSPGNLEVVARVGSQLYFFWRDSGPAFQWNGPFQLQSTIW